MKFQAHVSDIGAMVPELYHLSNSIIIFNETAVQEDLFDISILHKESVLNGTIEIGDTLLVGGKKFSIIKVGKGVNDTLKSLGHCSFVFGEAARNPVLPGQIAVRGELINPINLGDIIEIE